MGAHKLSSLKKQKRAIILLFAIALVLIVALLVVNQIVGIYPLTDRYLNEAGEECTEKYYVRRRNGSFVLCDKDGNIMEKNDEGLYLAASGNQYSVDAKTGKFYLFAEIAYDILDGETLGYANRVLMFPQLTMDNIYSVKVNNDSGEYEVYRTKKQTIYFRGFESEFINISDDTFARLCVGCGYTLATQKIDFSSPEMPKVNGLPDYSAYGLGEADTPASYTVTAGVYDDKGNCTPDTTRQYTVYVGDKLLSGDAYYAKLEGRDAIYVLSSVNLADTMMQPVEQLVVPQVLLPMSQTTASMVADFNLDRVVFNGDFTENDRTTIISFTYLDLDARINTLKTPYPYEGYIDLMKGYHINDDQISTLLMDLYEMEYIRCVKLGVDQEAREKYILTGPIHTMIFKPLITDAEGNTGYYNDKENRLYISPKTENGTYYVWSTVHNMIVEVDQTYFSFLEWETSSWYDRYFASEYLAYMKEFSFTVGGNEYYFSTDNTLSYSFYLDGTNSLAAVDPDTGSVKKLEDGTYRYTPKGSNKDYPAYVLNFDKLQPCTPYFDSEGILPESVLENGALLHKPTGAKEYRYILSDYLYSVLDEPYYDTVSKQYYQVYTDLSGNILPADTKTGVLVRREDGSLSYARSATLTVAVNASYMKLYDKNGQEISYTLLRTETTALGVQKTEEITAAQNFAAFWANLAYFNIEGDVDEALFLQNMGMTVEQFITSRIDNSDCTAMISYKISDQAASAIMNDYYITNEDGSTQKLYTSNNTKEVVLRFYQYSGQKTLLTVELIDSYDENDDPISDPSKAVGKFYVLASHLERLMSDIEKFATGQPVDAVR